jgi:eukaryotic-like serine/threonine-protein kinase
LAPVEGGEVYKALDPRLNRTVAVKILHEHISDSPEARARFEREAQTIARLNNPHICVVYATDDF